MSKILASVALASIALFGAAPMAMANTPAAAAAKPAYTTADTPLGDMLDDPAAKAVLEKHVPDLISNSSIDMARGMSLKAVQGYAGDMLTDAKLAAIDADLAKLPAK